MCYKLLKKTLLLTFCVVDMLIIVTELDKLLKIGPLQLSVAVSGSYVKIWLTLQLADVSDSPHLKVISRATLDNTTSMSHAGQKKAETTFSQKKVKINILCCSGTNQPSFTCILSSFLSYFAQNICILSEWGWLVIPSPILHLSVLLPPSSKH